MLLAKEGMDDDAMKKRDDIDSRMGRATEKEKDEKTTTSDER